MKILGISAFYHDSAAALVVDGHIVAAAQEERFTRLKFDASFPLQAIQFCLRQAQVSPSDIDLVAFYDNPNLKLQRLLKTHLAYAPAGASGFVGAARALLGGKLDQKRLLVHGLRRLDPAVPWESRISFGEHHLSHAAAAFYPSPFQAAAILTMDGVGEWATTTIAHGRGQEIRILKEMHFPHSIGLLYSAFTDYLGFRVNSDEYKVMGLAPYGVPRFTDLIYDSLIKTEADGAFALDMKYFDYHVGRRMVNRRFCELFGQPRRIKSEPLSQFHMDVAASVQSVTEQTVTALVAHALEITAETNLCLAGGVALNCVANGKLLNLGEVGSLWVQPAAGDAGSALGAALAAHYSAISSRVPNPEDSMSGSLLGPQYTEAEIREVLEGEGLNSQYLGDDHALCDTVVDHLIAGKVIGWFQGRMEFGPRALGARSIIGDPRNAALQRVLNLKVKFRESFRPFAPIVMEEHASDWFDLRGSSPYMLMVAPVSDRMRLPVDPALAGVTGADRLEIIRSRIPAVTHVDYSARIQTVSEKTNPLLYRLLKTFYEKTGCPVLINTSFNVNDEPIVCSPVDAVRCFLSTNIDLLCMGRFIVEQPQRASLLPAADVVEEDRDNIYAVF